MKKYLLVSPFNGFGGASQALKEAGFNIVKTYVSEVDKYANMVYFKNFPDAIQLGDVTQIETTTLQKIREYADSIGAEIIFIGGSPCQGFSIIGKRKGSTTECGIDVTSLKQYLQLKKEEFQFNGQSYLFWEYVRMKKILKPEWWLLENVNVSSEWLPMFNLTMGVDALKINSSDFSAQNRPRMYWTNIQVNTEYPICRDMISDILDDDAIFTNDVPNWLNKNRGNSNKKRIDLLQNKNSKASCLTASMYKGQVAMFCTNEKQEIHRYSMSELERLQTLPIGYTGGVSPTQRMKMLGNGFTVGAIKHIVKNIEVGKVKLIQTSLFEVAS